MNFTPKDTLLDKLQHPSKVFGTGKYGKCNIITPEKSTETAQNFNSDWSKVSHLPTCAIVSSYNFLL